MSLGASVAITRYADTDNTPGYSHGVMGQAQDTVFLHERDSDTESVAPKDLYRLVAWSPGSAARSLLAITSSAQVEIWDVEVASDIKATLKGSIDIAHTRGLVWNPRSDVLLIYSDKVVQLLSMEQPTLALRTIYERGFSRHEAWGACSWSPCGSTVSLALNRTLHCFSWPSIDAVLTELPKHEQVDTGSPFKDSRVPRQQLEVGDIRFGAIASVVHVSATVCILTTDTRLVLEDLDQTVPLIKESKAHFGGLVSTEATSVSSSLLLLPKTRQEPLVQDVVGSASSGIVDLTSLRISTSSARSSLQILNRTENLEATQQPSTTKPCSHLHILERKTAQWSITTSLELPRVASPDVLIAQEMRIIVGSTITPHLLVAHLDISERNEWTASLSGELELPSTHVCRGLYLAEKSPFVHVASTEKRKRATFFRAAANGAPQPIYLCTYKAPRRARPTITEAEANGAATGADKTSKSSIAAAEDDSSGKGLLELILANMTAMQTQLNARFDAVDKRLAQLVSRVEQLERK